MKTLVRNYDSLFNEVFNATAPLRPSANIMESDDTYTIDLAIPGFSKDDFKVEVKDRVLEISSSAETSEASAGDKYIRKEFGYRSFQRSFRLPRTVDVDAITATYANGILRLGLPKKEEAKAKEPRLISIN